MYHAFPGDQLRLPASDAETPPLDAPPPRRAARRAGLIGLVALLVLGFGLYRLLGAGEAQADAPPPPTVTVAQPLQRDVVEYEDFTGRFEASQSVEIRPRVSGQL